jgi:hypothetical protein
MNVYSSLLGNSQWANGLARKLSRDFFLCGLRTEQYNCVSYAKRIYERIRERGLTPLEFRSSKGTALWPREELENLVCEVACAVIR